MKSSTDHLGSSSVITDGNGSSVQALYYYPYGEIQSNIGIDVARYKFTGQEWDAETALYYYGARYYDPKLARFISADTIVPEPFYPQSLNRYAYCINNPIILRDLDGHEWDSFSSWVSSGWNSFTNWASNAWDSFTSSFGSGGGSRSYSYNTNFNVDYSDWQSKNNSPSVLSYNSYSSSSTSSVGIGGGSGASMTSVIGGGGNLYAANTYGNGTATDAGSGYLGSKQTTAGTINDRYFLQDCYRPMEGLGGTIQYHRFIWINEEKTGYGLTTYDDNVHYSSPGRIKIESKNPTDRGTWGYHCKDLAVSADQMTRLRQEIKRDYANPPDYHLKNYNCQDWVSDVFKRSGIQK